MSGGLRLGRLFGAQGRRKSAHHMGRWSLSYGSRLLDLDSLWFSGLERRRYLLVWFWRLLCHDWPGGLLNDLHTSFDGGTLLGKVLSANLFPQPVHV